MPNYWQSFSTIFFCIGFWHLEWVHSFNNNREMSWKYYHMLANGYRFQKCYVIPRNMTLCHNIGYNAMILPNHLQQEDLHDVILQANMWLPLKRSSCHPDFSRFMCSLYAPVCLKAHMSIKLLPCYELCSAVRDKCQPFMLRFGYNWPAMLDCRKYPKNNSMCISLTERNNNESTRSVSGISNTTVAIHSKTRQNNDGFLTGGRDNLLHSVHDDTKAMKTNRYSLANDAAYRKDGQLRLCPVCKPNVDEDKLQSQFCEANYVFKGRIQKYKRLDNHQLQLYMGKKIRYLKFAVPLSNSNRKVPQLNLRNDAGVFLHRLQTCDCSNLINAAKNPKGRRLKWIFFVKHQPKSGVILLMMPWKNSKKIKRALRKLRKQGDTVCHANTIVGMKQAVTHVEKPRRVNRPRLFPWHVQKLQESYKRRNY